MLLCCTWDHLHVLPLVVYIPASLNGVLIVAFQKVESPGLKTYQELHLLLLVVGCYTSGKRCIYSSAREPQVIRGGGGQEVNFLT